MRNNRSWESGFTLLEVLLTLTLVAALAGVSLPVSYQWIQANDVEIAASTTAQSLRRAQLLSHAVEGDTSWGVSIDQGDDNKIVVFQGSSFDERDAAYDEEFELSEAITVSGNQEIVFSEFTGTPQATGEIEFSVADTLSRKVSINAKGIVSH